MPRRHRGVGGEDAFIPHRLDILSRNGLLAGPLLVQELQGEQPGMALVHVVPLDAVVAQGPQHADSADS